MFEFETILFYFQIGKHVSHKVYLDVIQFAMYQEVYYNMDTYEKYPYLSLNNKEYMINTNIYN